MSNVKDIVSDYNLTSINTQELGSHLRATIDFGGNAFVLGRRGSSKTFQAKQAIKDMGCHEVYINASTIERTDVGGFPRMFDVKDQAYVDYMLPRYFRPLIEGGDDGKKCVALFDEIDKVDPSILAPLLEFTQFHTMNGRALKNLSACIFTGNHAAEGGQRPALPLLDRAEKYLLTITPAHWLEWASSREAYIHPSITAFIQDNQDMLFGAVDCGEDYADPSPRGWHNASLILNFGEKKGWNANLLTTKIAGCVGKKAGIKYSAYFDHYQVLLPIVKQIFEGKNLRVSEWNALEPAKQMVTTMIVCSRLARMLDEKKDEQNKLRAESPGKDFKRQQSPAVDIIGTFLQERVDMEMSLISIRSQIGIERYMENELNKNAFFDGILTTIRKRSSGQG